MTDKSGYMSRFYISCTPEAGKNPFWFVYENVRDGHLVVSVPCNSYLSRCLSEALFSQDQCNLSGQACYIVNFCCPNPVITVSDNFRGNECSVFAILPQVLDFY